MPEKLEKCVSDVKAQGKSDDSAWAICVSSTGEKPHKESLKDSIKTKYGETTKIQEKVNANRQVPFFNPPIKTGKIEPVINKTPKDVGGKRLNQDSILWKSIFDAQLKRNTKEPKY